MGLSGRAGCVLVASFLTSGSPITLVVVGVTLNRPQMSCAPGTARHKKSTEPVQVGRCVTVAFRVTRPPDKVTRDDCLGRPEGGAGRDILNGVAGYVVYCSEQATRSESARVLTVTV